MKEQIKQFAKELHISGLGVCEARIYTELYDILAQYHTPFTPPARKRLSPFDFIPDAKSVIMCAFNYFNGNISGNISKYARGTDYHTVVKNKLAALCEKIEAVHGAFSHYIFCDDSPLCDKYLAYLSGLGVFGRNHLLIHPTYGSYIFIGGIVTSLVLAPDKPLPGRCAGADGARRPVREMRLKTASTRRAAPPTCCKKGAASTGRRGHCPARRHGLGLRHLQRRLPAQSSRAHDGH